MVGKASHLVIDLEKVSDSLQVDPQANCSLEVNEQVRLACYRSSDSQLSADKMVRIANSYLYSLPTWIHDPVACHDKVAKNTDYQSVEAGMAYYWLKRSIQLVPGNPIAHRSMGTACSLLKQSSCARKHYTEFLKLAPEDPDAPAVRNFLETH
jgi:hypothetical protein